MDQKKGIVILDFGGQYAHLIARRVRQCGVFSEIKDAETPAEELKDAAGIILSGGPQSVYDRNSPQGDKKIFGLGIPILGICYGLQWMTKQLGGEVKPGKTKEYGYTRIKQCHPEHVIPSGDEERRVDTPLLFKNLPEKFTVWMSHGDEASKLPEGFIRTAATDACRNVAFENPAKRFFAVQFHPEVVHTQHGQDILKRFIDLCNTDPWSIASYKDHISRQIKDEVKDRKVFMLVSGGVDSTVAFTLLNEILGSTRVQGLLVDTGLMRKNEIPQIKEAFDKLGITNLRIEDSSEEFFTNLKEVYEPEKKRKIIGQTFLEVQKHVSHEMNLKIEDGWMLGQGTIYPDTIETGGTKHADQIKTHHNRVPEVQKMIDKGLVIEPLKELYKDEVRQLGEELGLPYELVWRHPFPGPGLGVRILCAEEQEIIPENINIDYLSQPLPIKSVGVQGDGRSYRHSIALFTKSKLPDDTCYKLATEIPNKFSDFNRVVFCTSHQEPVSINFSPGYLSRQRADLLREADAIVDEEMHQTGLYEEIWQFPVVLLPFGINQSGQSIVLRPIQSTEAMTANAYRLPDDVLIKITEKIMALDGIDLVFLDLTNKPPGTIEWE